MSLLRRREMMQEEKTEYAGILYIDSGFLNEQVRYDGTPIYNANYPDAWATTYFPVRFNDVINCKETEERDYDTRVRFYYSNGTKAQYNKGGAINIIVADPLWINARLMGLYSDMPIPNELTVVHPNGTIDAYKIIDRR